MLKQGNCEINWIIFCKLQGLEQFYSDEWSLRLEECDNHHDRVHKQKIWRM